MDQDQDREERELLNGLVDGTLNLDSLRNDSPGDIIQHDDDAIDYEDISDDDLPDEEPATQPSRGAIDEGTSHETRDEFDDLFDDPDHDHHPSPPTSGIEEFQDASSPAEHDDQKRLKSGPFGITEEMRRMNFNNQDPDIPDAADNVQDTLAAAFPGWLPGKVLDFNTLLPTKPARITEKKPAKPPKPLLPTKLNLELDNGQQNIFRMPGNATLSATQRAQFYEAENLVPLVPNQPIEEALDHEDSYDDDTPVAGYSLQEWDIICSDWTANEPVPALTNDSKSEDEDGDSDTFEFDDEQEQPPAKKRKTRELGLPELPKYVAPNFDNYETATARNGNRVLLDMNDPFLLVDEEDHPPKRLKTQAKSTANGNRVRSMRSRLNYSNDDEYLALNQNHSNKIRATLGNFSVEHSAPALKLMWPFYKAKPQYQQAWFEDFHRPKFNPRYVMHLSAKWERPRKRKRKDTKGKKVQEIFATTRDLSLNDNSTAVLFEYCEETPTTMSKFGMGNRVINYYRRKPGDDSESKQQKADLGETHVLQPEDRSPFSIFGTVDPGETVPTLHNQMFRAPIFKHEPREGDFLLGRTTMGLDKRSDSCTWFLRKIDHLYTVGQTFPSVEVPGPRARKVTTMTSNRMKMVAYRMMHRRNTRTVGLSEITQHIAGSTDSQNRQKLKEFLQYEKEKKQWGLREGEELMSSAKIRNMIKPEDVCLIDAMHVGLGTLDYAEYKKQAKPPRDKEKDDEDDNEPIVQDDSSKTLMMAPWYTTKAFIDASAGKAMLQLHGEGDPTGHGLGFSFVRTSMKGGYIESLQGPNATSQELMERERKANGGHSYNVRRQDELYNAAIKQIWSRQKETLSDDKQHEDDDVVQTHDEDNRFGNDDDTAHDHGTVAAPTPLGFDDSVSQVSRSTSMTNRKRQGEVLVIRRKVRNEFGEIVPQVVQITDPDIAALYLTRRKEHLAEKTDLLAIAPTHDEELNKLLQEKIDDELERLVKNQARRVVREKQKAGKDGKGTARKCANCGQIGHIKTNKKLCPMFNGGATPASPAPPPPPPPVPTPSSPAGLVSSGAGEQN